MWPQKLLIQVRINLEVVAKITPKDGLRNVAQLLETKIYHMVGLRCGVLLHRRAPDKFFSILDDVSGPMVGLLNLNNGLRNVPLVEEVLWMALSAL